MDNKKLVHFELTMTSLVCAVLFQNLSSVFFFLGKNKLIIKNSQRSFTKLTV